MNRKLALALVHHPVLDRNGKVVTAAVTNLDLHDLARIGRTYGVGRLFVVTPVAEQQRLVERILAHWAAGLGATAHPDRSEALALVETVTNLEEALTQWGTTCGARPVPLLTGANRSDGISFAAGRQLVGQEAVLLVFGTGWGLAPELFERGWPVLEPVTGPDPYNHLPVRAAAAIILDRLSAPAISGCEITGADPGDRSRSEDTVSE